MKAEYNVTGAQRKDLVKVISKAIGQDAKYLGAPSFGYRIGSITVDRNGCIETENSEELKKAMTALENNGFHTDDPMPQEQEEEPEMHTEPETTDPKITPMEVREPDGLNISIPKDTLTEDQLENLKRIVEAKGNLIRHAFAAEALPIEVSDDKITFPWFKAPATPEEVHAYTEFISRLVKMAAHQKRITARERETENEKYAFRCFLLRLGFIGNSYKPDRKIMLRNLTGSSAFRDGHRKGESA